MTTPTVTIDGVATPLPAARVVLGIPEHACFGCYVGDDAPQMHDLCVLADLLDDGPDLADEVSAKLDRVGDAIKAMAHAPAGTGQTCPGCGQVITVDDDGSTECGGEGEGICCVVADDDECDFHPDGHDPAAVAAARAAHGAAYDRCTCPPTRHAIDPNCPVDGEALVTVSLTVEQCDWITNTADAIYTLHVDPTNPDPELVAEWEWLNDLLDRITAAQCWPAN
jgi:hypothetical protein